MVLSQFTAPAYALALLEDGSAGRAYLLKERVAGVDELAQAIRVVAERRLGHRPARRRRARVGAREPAHVGPRRSLTPRESEILAEMAQGKSNNAIAETLGVSERAVEKHSNSIFSKLGLSEERDANRRVKAVFVYLSEHDGGMASTPVRVAPPSSWHRRFCGTIR